VIAVAVTRHGGVIPPPAAVRKSQSHFSPGRTRTQPRNAGTSLRQSDASSCTQGKSSRTGHSCTLRLASKPGQPEYEMKPGPARLPTREKPLSTAKPPTDHRAENRPAEAQRQHGDARILWVGACHGCNKWRWQERTQHYFPERWLILGPLQSRQLDTPVRACPLRDPDCMTKAMSILLSDSPDTMGQ
jgi:hypothetical protein